jgi:hypothetical protein
MILYNRLLVFLFTKWTWKRITRQLVSIRQVALCFFYVNFCFPSKVIQGIFVYNFWKLLYKYLLLFGCYKISNGFQNGMISEPFIYSSLENTWNIKWC